MKSIILLAATLIGFMAMSSCQKDKAVNNPAVTAGNRNANTTKVKPTLVFGPDRYRVYYDYGGTAFGCVYTGGNCLDDIIIVKPQIRELGNIIIGGGDYVAYIRGNMEALSADFPQEYLEAVVNGKYTLSVRTDNDVDMQYFIAKDQQSIALVIPFSKK